MHTEIVKIKGKRTKYAPLLCEKDKFYLPLYYSSINTPDVIKAAQIYPSSARAFQDGSSIRHGTGILDRWTPRGMPPYRPNPFYTLPYTSSTTNTSSPSTTTFTINITMATTIFIGVQHSCSSAVGIPRCCLIKLN